MAAGGGGSAAAGGPGEGLGGASGAAGAGNGVNSGGGQAGTGGGGGAGGSGEPANPLAGAGDMGHTGVLGVGGAGGAGGAEINMSSAFGDGGGGAGGGFFGGGGGGGGGGGDEESAGGGGGASLVPPSASGSMLASDTTGVPSLTISFTPTFRSTSTSVSCHPSLVVAGEATGCRATVSDTDTGSASTPSGPVSFSSNSPGSFDSSAACTLAPSATPGVASCTISYTPSAVGAGTHTLTGAYGGDATDGPSSAAATVSVTTGTTTALHSSANPAAVGQQFTYTAVITPAPTVAGFVAFTDNGAVIRACAARPILDGEATCQSSYAAAGNHVITASYPGGGVFPASTSPTLTEVVVAPGTTAPVPTSVKLSSSENPSLSGDNVTFIATIKPVPDRGTVEFVSVNGSPIAGCAARPVNRSGEAGCGQPIGRAGAYDIEAAYSGTATYTGSQSATLTQTVLTVAKAVAPAPVTSWARVENAPSTVAATVTTAPSPSGWSVTAN